ncbi:SDR family NAD(P)-dependent oxidoreductase [Streptomyces sp. OK228]|jgi:NAD(P)-dependent dehydrogenase (short-subunit alcohol dehydrogenase family)|uniref:SDR family NAD(P)-dependent oxidoreductase n=1 Tax=Streptomyces TaxID=1883 RepID=UPI000BDD82F1|nr:SDR family NAD(P)-dependent oxidoreductase [Streptomyces sp. OK228]SOE19894.1 short chain dehydrogenase [Streptomyces sp. OK228]
MDLRLADKVVVVTGAASGIGQATARLLTEGGAVVVGVDRDPVVTGPTRTPLEHGSAVRAATTS